MPMLEFLPRGCCLWTESEKADHVVIHHRHNWTKIKQQEAPLVALVRADFTNLGCDRVLLKNKKQIKNKNHG